VQKNFHGARIRIERRDATALHARVHVRACARALGARKSDDQKAPILRAFLAQREICDDVCAIARDLRARVPDRCDDRGVTTRARVVVVHTSSIRFGFFRLLRYYSMCSARRFGLHDIATHSLLGGQHGEESEEGKDREEKEEEGQEEVTERFETTRSTFLMSKAASQRPARPKVSKRNAAANGHAGSSRRRRASAKSGFILHGTSRRTVRTVSVSGG
jgi:hypothetical protein